MGARRHEGEGVSTFEMSVPCRVMEEPVRLVRDGVREEDTSSKKAGTSNGGVVSPRVTDH